METAIYKIEFLDGRIFKIFCANKTQKNKVIQTMNKLTDKIRVSSQLTSGLHTEKQWSEISELILNNEL